MAAETKIIIKGIPPYDGEYELDFEQSFSAREWRLIKQISEGSITFANYEKSVNDPDFLIALAVIVLRRSGKIQRDAALEVADELADAPMDGARIALVIPKEEEVDPVPPALAVAPEKSFSRSSTANDEPESDSSVTDGASSRIASATLDENPEPTGVTRSATF